MTVQATGHTGGTFAVENPSTRQLLAELPDCDREAVDGAVRRAQDAWPEWADRPGGARARLLNRLADLLEEEGPRLAELESSDNGRPVRETLAQQAIVPGFYRYFAGWCDKIEGTTIPVGADHLNYTERVPVGVCAAITPWNHPLLIATKKIAPALASGNVVLCKPSELAPLSVVRLGELAEEAGIPAGVLQVVTGQRGAGEVLTIHPGVDRVDLTGSTATGIAIQQQAAPSMKRIGLELGGKAANIVFADADFPSAVQGATFAGFVAQGQTCIAGARVLVESPLLDKFVESFSASTRAIRVGDPLVAETQMGPVISGAARERIASFVDEALSEGAELVAGDSELALEPRLQKGHFLAPTVLLTENPGLRAAQEEIFGPVVTVIPFDREDDAVRIANDVPFGLGAAVWTGDVARAHRVARRLRAGTVWINDYHRIHPASPWGGFKLSGYGRENGVEAIRMFTEVRSTWVRVVEPAPGWYDTNTGQRLN